MSINYCIVLLYCIVLYCIVLYCIVLYCFKGWRILNSDSLKTQLAKLERMYPDYGKDGKLLTLKVSKERCAGKVVVMGPRGDETPFLRKKEQ